MPTFFRQIMDAFLVRTDPDSSMVNPAHIHMTSAPQTRNEKVLRTKRRLRVHSRRVRDGRTGQQNDEPNDPRYRQGGKAVAQNGG